MRAPEGQAELEHRQVRRAGESRAHECDYREPTGKGFNKADRMLFLTEIVPRRM